MWKVNEVLQFDDKLYRILSINLGQVVWIALADDKALPEYILEYQLCDLIDLGRLSRAEDPYTFIKNEEVEPFSIAFEKRAKNLKTIETIICDDQCFDSKTRASRIRMVQQAGLASKVYIYRLLRRFWQRGQHPNALLPDYKNAGAKGLSRSSSHSTQKAGRSRQFGEGQGVKITEDIEKLFRRIIEKTLLTQKKLQISAAHRRLLDLFAQYYPDTSPEDYPTLRQFRYFYDREYKKTERLISQNHPGIYKKDIRPLLSTATSQALGPGSRYEIDATIADIYLVDNEDTNKIVGRPTLYIVIDVFSRMITGFYIGLGSPSYSIAMQAIVNACSDKSEICKDYGIEIMNQQWPCIGLPAAILADRGEMMSHQVDNLISNFNVRIESAPPRRGDAKGIVESCFRTLQSEFKPYMPGVVSGQRVKRHGERDYRLDAIISIKDFTEIILRTILFRNNHHVMDKYDRGEDMPADLPSIPIDLWSWGMQYRVGSLRPVDSNDLRIALLPRKKATFSAFGVNLWGLYYTGKEIMREGWFQRSTEIKRPQSLQAAYDPASADVIYLFPQENSRIYWVCSLTERSRQYRGMTFWQVWDIQAEEKNNKANAKIIEMEKRRELDSFLQEKLASSVKKASKSSEVLSASEKLRNIKENKKQAHYSERKTQVIRQAEKQDGELAEIISMQPKDDDYGFPQFIPSLFEDTPEDKE